MGGSLHTVMGKGEGPFILLWVRAGGGGSLHTVMGGSLRVMGVGVPLYCYCGGGGGGGGGGAGVPS